MPLRRLSHRIWRHRARAMSLVALSALPSAGAMAPSAGAATTTTAQRAARSLLAQVLAAAKAEPSVHYTTTSSVGPRSFTVVGDAAAHGGTQDITLTNGRQVSTMEIRLVRDTLYFEGDKQGLETYLGLSSALASRYAGRWISMSHSTQGFSNVANSLKLNAVVAQISLGGSVTLAPSPSGASTVTLAGTSGALSTNNKRGPASLVVTAGTPPLPVVFHAQGKDSGKVAVGSVTFSNWGEQLLVVAPPHPIPSTSIR